VFVKQVSGGSGGNQRQRPLKQEKVGKEEKKPTFFPHKQTNAQISTYFAWKQQTAVFTIRFDLPY
jgi:hypothetical protein